jgi:uncharacterized membrane protein YfcA
MPNVRHIVDPVVQHPFRTALFVVWLGILAMQENVAFLLTNFGVFGFLGVVGAVFANATGAGGGVVFVPFFNYLGFSNESIVATSFAIQCCGMTAGAITWWQYKHKNHRQDPQWRAFSNLLVLSVPATLCGVWLAQYGPSNVEILASFNGGIEKLHLAFGVFSVLLAVAIFASIPLLTRAQYKQDIQQSDIIPILFVAFVGGIITAWLSIGVGEMVAVYLIIRGFNVTMAIALAVVLSAFAVWGGVVYHLLVTQSVNWHVVIFAGAGAILGGVLAKHLVLLFSPTYLKLFFGTWVLLLGVSGLPVFSF